jgi:hypothetical protein
VTSSSPADALFAGLTKRQSMLLLIASAFGGSNGSQSFEHLPDDERDILRECAAKLSGIPRETRVPFLIQEIKRLMVGARGSELTAVDARAVASALESERPAVAEVVLRALPATVASEVRKQRVAPPQKPGRDLRPEVLSVIRWHFEKRLESLSPRSATFLFSDVVALSTRELMVLVNEVGARELAPMLASLPPSERAEFLASIPAAERAACLRSATAEGDLGELRARQELKERSQGDARHVVRRVGMQLLARACVGQSVELASRLIEKHKDQVRRLLIHAVRVERAAGRPREPERLQKRVIEQMSQLARIGLIEPPARRQSAPLPAAPPRPRTARELPPVPPPPGRRPVPKPRPAAPAPRKVPPQTVSPPIRGRVVRAPPRTKPPS